MGKIYTLLKQIEAEKSDKAKLPHRHSYNNIVLTAALVIMIVLTAVNVKSLSMLKAYASKGAGPAKNVDGISHRISDLEKRMKEQEFFVKNLVAAKNTTRSRLSAVEGSLADISSQNKQK
jgi:hypothetical protein